MIFADGRGIGDEALWLRLCRFFKLWWELPSLLKEKFIVL
jgi:hypothetical protein